MRKRRHFGLLFLSWLLVPLWSVAAQRPAVVETVDSPTILRSGPSEDYDRIAEIPKGLRLVLESSSGEWSRLQLSQTLSVWCLSKSLKAVPLPPSRPVLERIKIKAEKADVRMEITESEPGVVLTEEWIRPPALWLRFQNGASALSEIDYDPKAPLIEHVEVRQETSDTAAVRIDLKGLYGYRFIQKDPEHLIIKFKIKKEREAQILNGWTICLDPGHGGKDHGATGPTGLEEKNVTLEISRVLAGLLQSKGARVILTRTTDTQLAAPDAPPQEELEDRVNVARAHHVDLFISIHCNARPTVWEARRARGSYVYFYQPQSLKLAAAVSEDLQRQILEPKYGIIFRSLHVIREPDFPSILVETVFISNPVTEALLRRPSYRMRSARGILQGIEDYAREEIHGRGAKKAVQHDFPSGRAGSCHGERLVAFCPPAL